MSQIMYNYPAMLGLAGEMAGYAGALNARGCRYRRRAGRAERRLAGRHRYDLPGVAGAVEHQHERAGPGLPGDGQHPRDEHRSR